MNILGGSNEYLKWKWVYRVIVIMRSHVLTLSEENGYYRTSRQAGLRNAYKLEDLL